MISFAFSSSPGARYVHYLTVGFSVFAFIEIVFLVTWLMIEHFDPLEQDKPGEDEDA